MTIINENKPVPVLITLTIETELEAKPSVAGKRGTVFALTAHFEPEKKSCRWARLKLPAKAHLTVSGIYILYNPGRRCAPIGDEMKNKKPKWPTSLRWENIVAAIIFFAIMWLVTHVPMPPG
jgi:hypothetical protein